MDFIDKIFGDKKFLTLEEYIRINQDVSSEMFVSLMRVLHSCIPCTNNFFKLYEKNCPSQAGRQKVKKIASPTIVAGLRFAGSPRNSDAASMRSPKNQSELTY